MPVDWDALVLAPNMETFAEPVTFIPAGGGVITMFGGSNIGRGVFDQGNKDLTFDDGVATTTEIPTLGVRLSEFNVAPKVNDLIQVPSVNTTYIVMEVRLDGHGWARLMLSKVSSP